MILILFISICIAWYFYQYFENKRMDRLHEQQDKRRESFEQLLKMLKKNEHEEIKH
jgi:peptidoglycan/LPS O-acetylase OafA/YrhL